MTSPTDHDLAIALPLRFQRSEIAAHARFRGAAAAALEGARGPDELIRALARLNDPLTLATGLAFVLPKRQAVWWACIAARLGIAGQTEAPKMEALRVAEAWVQTGSEEYRELAEGAAAAADHDGPAAWAAQAAFWSGESIAPPGQPMVPPPPHLTAMAVRAALLTAANSPYARADLAGLCEVGLAVLAGGDGIAEMDSLARRHGAEKARAAN